jgi:serine/threonine-protein kinase
MSTPVAPGDVVAEKYRVDRVLGRGGMGVVVAAEHLQLGQHVAIKFLLPAALGNADAVTRFEREARAAVRLHSEHVARVLDVGRLPGGEPYMVIEYLEGADLASELESRGALPPKEAIKHLLQACDALAEAHSLGIIHRDIKPANLFLARRPNRAPIIKVLDFGISKTTSVAQSASALTATSALMGSPLYMSPEQLRTTRDVDARTDVWALGVTLYELLSGTTPFGGESVAELCAQILTAPPTPLSERAATRHVPPAVEALVLKCLEKDPARRFASVAELTTALEALAASDLAPSVPQLHASAPGITVAMSSRLGTGPTPAMPIATPSSPMPASTGAPISGPNLGPISSTGSELRGLGVTAGAASGSGHAGSPTTAIVAVISVVGLAAVIGGALFVIPRIAARRASAVASASATDAPPSAAAVATPVAAAPPASVDPIAPAETAAPEQAPATTASSSPAPKPVAPAQPAAPTAQRSGAASATTATPAPAIKPTAKAAAAAPAASASAPAKKKSPLDMEVQ